MFKRGNNVFLIVNSINIGDVHTILEYKNVQSKSFQQKFKIKY